MSKDSLYEEVKTDCAREFQEVLHTQMTDTSVESLVSVQDSVLCEEIDRICPMLKLALQSAIGQDDVTEDKFKAIRLQCYSLVFKARWGQNIYSIIAHSNDQLLMAAGGNKASFGWFNKMCVTNCYSTARTKHKTLAENHDKEITEWKRQVEAAASLDDVKEEPDVSKCNGELVCKFKFMTLDKICFPVHMKGNVDILLESPRFSCQL